MREGGYQSTSTKWDMTFIMGPPEVAELGQLNS